MAHLEHIQKLTRDNFDQLRSQFPGFFNAGGCLLLGRQYAHPASRVLVLGINPGPSDSVTLDVRRQEYDYLLSGPDKPRHQNWTNARKFFNASPRLLDAVRLATFAFCCPYRTQSWSAMPRPVKTALADSSRDLLGAIIQDCSPTLLIVTGVDGFRLFAEIMGNALQVQNVIGSGGDGRLHQWSAYRAQAFQRMLTIVQVPHFSRAGEVVKLQQCANWLVGLNGGIERTLGGTVQPGT